MPPRRAPAAPSRRLPESLDAGWLGWLIACALTPKELRGLVRRTGLDFPGFRLQKMTHRQIADGVAEEYGRAEDFRPPVEEALAAVGGEFPLPARLAAEGARALVEAAAWKPEEALLRLACALLLDSRPKVQETGLQALRWFADLEEEAHAAGGKKEGGGEAAAPGAGPAQDGEGAGAGVVARIQRVEERSESLQRQLAAARQEIASRNATIASLRAEVEGRRGDLAAVRADLEAAREEARRAAGPRDLRVGLEDARRRAEAAEEDLAGARRENAALAERLREMESSRGARGERESPGGPPDPEPGDGNARNFVLPVLTREFYDSVEGWDPRVVRTAFRKVLLLADSPNHPSLDLKTLQGVEGLFRVRIASDVRLVMRRGEGGAWELLALIDREDLQRYVNQYKTRG